MPSARRAPEPVRPTALSHRLWAVLAVAALLSGGTALAQPAPRVNVVATVGMIGDIAAEVAGDCANVTVMMGPGSDPHLYRASAGDVRSLQNADLILYGGLFLEGRLSEVLTGFANRTRTVPVSEVAIPPEQRLAGVGYAFDPHVWMDASQWAAVPGVIAEALIGAPGFDAACTDGVWQRADGYRDQLLALHRWALEALTGIPEQRRVLVTAHDAFQYFGRAYDIAVVGIQGVSTESEAAVADIRRVIDVVMERSVPTLFVESTINPRTIEAVVEGVRQRGGGAVAIGQQLYADALGASGTPEGTYIGMFIHNVRAITSGLGGAVPDLPAALAPWLERWLAEARVALGRN